VTEASTIIVNRGTDPDDQLVIMIPIGQIEPDPGQPRKEFEPVALQELALSIQADGLQQFPVVRPCENRYRLIAGERRWRASQLAGLTEIPCVVRDVDANRAFELAIIENDLREDLKPMERAEAYGRLMGPPWSKTLEQVAVAMKKTTDYIEKGLRLLNLRPEYQDALRRGVLSHAQALDLARVPAERQPQIFRMYVRGADSCDTARVITAILEVDDPQIQIPDEGETDAAAHRFDRMLAGIAGQIGRCYSKPTLELLGWVSRGSLDKNLELVGLLIKQLTKMQDALRQAKARRTVRSSASSESAA